VTLDTCDLIYDFAAVSSSAMSARINTCVYFCNLMLDIQKHPVVYFIYVSVAVCYRAPIKNSHRC